MNWLILNSFFNVKTSLMWWKTEIHLENWNRLLSSFFYFCSHEKKKKKKKEIKKKRKKRKKTRKNLLRRHWICICSSLKKGSSNSQKVSFSPFNWLNAVMYYFSLTSFFFLTDIPIVWLRELSTYRP